MSLSTLRVVDSFEESDEIMKSSSKPVVRLQAGLDAHRNTKLTESSLRNLIHNIRIFHDMASKCQKDVLFLQVTDGSLCYWTFYSNGHWIHQNNYLRYAEGVQIETPEDIIRGCVGNLEKKASMRRSMGSNIENETPIEVTEGSGDSEESWEEHFSSSSSQDIGNLLEMFESSLKIEH